MLRVGIDVGGTHTDAVLMDGDDIVSVTKALTTRDIFSGTVNALDAVLSDDVMQGRSLDAIMLGTTQFTNAVVERRELSPVAAVRIGLPSGAELPPLVGWPEDLADALGRQSYLLHGGRLYDGHPLAAFRDDEVDALIESLKCSAAQAVCVTSVFAPMDPAPELELAERLSSALPKLHITLSHTMGQLGLLERENAALLNTALLPFADRVVSAFTAAIGERGLDCPFFISQNDGTLMQADFARNFPALTFASGPTNSLRGASRLTGLDNAIVVDIGGTTSDIGILNEGFPRESNTVLEVGGVRTNFRMPDILAIGLGGGSQVSDDGQQVGPQSVGHRLVQAGRVFGGDTLTATDIVVAEGQAEVGDADRVRDIDASVLANARACMTRLLNRGVDSMKPDRNPLPVILVGGGAILVTEALDGASEVVRPQHAAVANAIGAAIAQIGGEREMMVSYEKMPRDEAVAEVTRRATAVAVEAGADAATVRVSDIEETSISYMPGGMTRLRIKVVGDIDVNRFGSGYDTDAS